MSELKTSNVRKVLDFILFKIADIVYYFYSCYGKNILRRLTKRNNKKRISKFPFKGSGLEIHEGVTVIPPLQLALGNNVHIGSGTYVNAMGGVAIGDNTHISRNVSIYSTNHDYKGMRLPYDTRLLTKPVFIGRNVWIGRGVSITPGCIIGEGAVINMSAVVTKDVAPFSIVGGNPARNIGNRDEDHYSRLMQGKAFGGANGQPLSLDVINKSITELNTVPFFIVGTGRCGTKYLANKLSCGKLLCRHEPNTVLVNWVTEYTHGNLSLDSLRSRMKMIFDEISFIPFDCKYYGESDQKFSFCIPILRELFPTAKFIWLIRDPKDFVASVLPRGWYDDYEMGYSEERGKHYKPHANDLHSHNRIRGDKTNQIDESEWVVMSEFERSCWYYKFTNHLIKDELSEMSEGGFMKVSTDRLGDGDTISTIRRFVGAENCVDAQKGKKTSQNASKYERYQENYWTKEEVGMFEKWFGK